MPAADILKEVRLHLAEHGDRFKEIVEDKEFKAVFPSLFDDKLKPAPKGFPKDHECIDLICYKSFIYSIPLKNELFSSETYVEIVVNAFRQLAKVNAFLNEPLKNI